MEHVVIERIKKIIEYTGLSQRQFALNIGVPPMTLNSLLSRKSDPSFSLINAIAIKYVEVSADWLLTGVGTMLKEQEEKKIELDFYQDEVTNAGDFMKALERKDSQLEKMQHHIDKLLTIIENLTATEKKSSAPNADLAQTG